jgi:hypothetical protein
VQNKALILPVKVVGKQMVIENQSQATSGSGGSKGLYKLNIRTCNPACGK